MFKEGENNPYSADYIRKVGIKPWIAYYLEGEGSNPDLLKGIDWHARFFSGPLEVQSTVLHRIAGPESDMLYQADALEWERTVTQLMTSIRDERQMPPLIVVDFIDSDLAIADGNKRFEAQRRLGYENSMAIFCLKKDPRTYNLIK